MLSVSTRIGRYEVREHIGAGGMGEVYCARDTTLDRDVALKILSGEALDIDRIRRFQQEARAASSLSHPNIAHVYDAGECDVDGQQRHFIAMELIDGVSLRQLIDEGADVQRLLATLAQVADALARAHDAGILHRDLKPENIMVTRDGYAKVVDFGLAKLFETSQPLTRHDSPTALLTPSGVIAGTPAYMSPEQLQGKPLGAGSDVFSLGIVLYEVASGRRPFVASSAIDLMYAVVHTPAPHVPDANLDSIVQRCLEKDPDERYASAAEVATGIRHYLSATLPVNAGGEGSMRKVVGLGTLAATVLAAVLFLSNWDSPAERRDPDVRPAETPNDPLQSAWSDLTQEQRAENLRAIAEPRFENGKRVYTGFALRLSLSNAALDDVLLLMSQATGVDFLLEPGVTATVSIHAENTPWDAIFERILEQNGLVYRVDDTVVVISSSMDKPTQ